jgi:hypothetical protein
MRGRRLDPAAQQGEVPLALLEGIARGAVPVIVGAPTHPEDEMAGAGTLISGLKPVAPPASVAASGMAASLNADPKPGANDDGMLGVAGSPDTLGLQVPAIVDVPNGDVVGVTTLGSNGVPNWVVAGVPNGVATGANGDVTSGKNGTVVDVVPVIPGSAPDAALTAGHVAMAPMAPGWIWPAPRLS